MCVAIRGCSQITNVGVPGNVNGMQIFPYLEFLQNCQQGSQEWAKNGQCSL